MVARYNYIRATEESMNNTIGHVAASNCSLTLLKAIGLEVRVRVNNGVFIDLGTPAASVWCRSLPTICYQKLEVCVGKIISHSYS